MKFPRMDIGLIWAKYVNIYGQLGSLAGILSMVMTIGIFYTTTLYPIVKIPFWLYVLIITVGAGLVVWFILKIGISGWYRYFSQQSELHQANVKMDAIMEHLGMNWEEIKKQKGIK